MTRAKSMELAAYAMAPQLGPLSMQERLAVVIEQVDREAEMRVFDECAAMAEYQRADWAGINGDGSPVAGLVRDMILLAKGKRR